MMSKTNLIAAMLLLFFGLAGTIAAAPNGEALYQEHCAACHSQHGLGGIGLPLTAEKLKTLPDSYIQKTIRLGRPGRIMPGFQALSDAQVNSIIQHLRTTEKAPAPKPYSEKTAKGNADRGKLLIAKHCSKCHGENGKAQGLGTGVSQSRERKFTVMPPAITNSGFLAAASDDFIKQIILNGRDGTEMPAFKKRGLKAQEANDIISFLRTQNKLDIDKEKSKQLKNKPATLTFESPYDFKTTANNLKLSIEGKNFRYFPDRLLEKGLTTDESVNRKQLTIRFCNFADLYKMLKVEPRLGVLLPCRITITEDENGKVKLIAMDMSVVATLFNNQQLENMAAEMQDAQIEIIEEATL